MLGYRIHRARKASGLSLRELAEKISLNNTPSLSHTSIKKYEDNKMTPSSDILIRLAKALNVKVEYFFRAESSTLANIRWRKHADMLKGDLEEIEAKILDQIEQQIELENLFPTAPIKKFSAEGLVGKIKKFDDVESFSVQVRQKWNLGLEPISDLINIIEEHGIKVFEIDNRKYQKFDGLLASINDIPVIVIGNQWPGDRQRFTLAHELGHLFLEGRPTKEINEEKYCNHFAGAFLLPKASIINILGEHRTYIEPKELALLKKEFGISMTRILHRAKDTGIISGPLYTRLRTEFNQNGWTLKEPGEPYPKEKTYIFEQMIFRALAEEYIGESKAAELMSIPIKSLRSLRAIEN